MLCDFEIHEGAEMYNKLHDYDNSQSIDLSGEMELLAIAQKSLSNFIIPHV